MHLQMTVVETYVDGKKLDPADNGSQLSPTMSSLLFEGITQNTTGSVFVPEVSGATDILRPLEFVLS